MLCPCCGSELDPPGSARAEVKTFGSSINFPSMTGVAHEDDGNSERIRTVSQEFKSSTEKTGETIRQEFEGARPQHEDDVLQVCATLREALNAAGGTWGQFTA